MAVTIDSGEGTPRIITNDVLSVTLDTTRELADVTGVDKTAKQRLGMLNDATVTLTGAWNPAANPTFYSCFKDIATTNIDRTVVLLYPGPATFTAEMALESVNYSVSGGQLTCSVTLQLSGGTQGVWS
jgi:hypothetical protein